MFCGHNRAPSPLLFPRGRGGAYFSVFLFEWGQDPFASSYSAASISGVMEPTLL